MLRVSCFVRNLWKACIFFFLLLVPVFGFATEPDITIRRITDRFYDDPEKSPLNTLEPNAFMIKMTRRLEPGKALDIAMGQGRNAIYLAQNGWQVTGFDISETGISRAQEEAARLGLKLDARVVSGEEFDFGTEQWDLVVLCYIDSRRWLDRIRQSVRPGGAILLEYYHSDTRKQRPMEGNPDKTFDSNELLQLFPGFRILHYEDVLELPDWSNRPGEKERLVRLLAQKEAETRVECKLKETIHGQGEVICWKGIQFSCGEKGWTKSGSCGKGSPDPLPR
jgi:SAM-dependent methyltransferase